MSGWKGWTGFQGEGEVLLMQKDIDNAEWSLELREPWKDGEQGVEEVRDEFGTLERWDDVRNVAKHGFTA
jgi:hypothetical protein